jgi:hypothetical protein
MNCFAAILGDAEAAIQLFSQPPYSEITEYGDWLQEVKAKAKREQKRASADEPAGNKKRRDSMR